MEGTLTLPGTELAYDVTGSGPAIVLVHGFSLDRRVWDDQARALAGTATVVRYDLRGFGPSTWTDPAAGYTHAGDLLALLDHLDIAEATLAGLSLGGMVVLHAAVLAPQRVTRLVLIDAMLEGVPWDDDSWQALRSAARLTREDGPAAGRAAWADHPLNRHAHRDPAVAARLDAMLADYSFAHWLHRDPHLAYAPNPIDVLDRITAPTTVLVGADDVPGFREMAARLASGIPAAHLVVVPGAGHLLPLEAPDAVSAALLP